MGGAKATGLAQERPPLAGETLGSVGCKLFGALSVTLGRNVEFTCTAAVRVRTAPSDMCKRVVCEPGFGETEAGIADGRAIKHPGRAESGGEQPLAASCFTLTLGDVPVLFSLSRTGSRDRSDVLP